MARKYASLPAQTQTVLRSQVHFLRGTGGRPWFQEIASSASVQRIRGWDQFTGGRPGGSNYVLNQGRWKAASPFPSVDFPLPSAGCFEQPSLYLDVPRYIR